MVCPPLKPESQSLSADDLDEGFRRIYEATPAMMHSINGDGCIELVTDAWLYRLGYTREQVLGRPSVDFLTPRSAAYATEVILPAYFKTGRCEDVAYQFVCADGSLVDVLLSATAQIDASGKFVRSLAVLTDVTEKNRAIEQKLHLQRQLHQSQKMEAVGRLAGGIAHDFNNLLTVIFTYGNFVLEALDADSRSYSDMAQIIRAAESATELLKKLLAFSAGRATGGPAAKVDQTIEQIQPLLRPLLGPGVELTLELACDQQAAHIDRSELEQVLVNLVVNARDAMPAGGKLTIRTRPIAQQTSVSDAQSSHPSQLLIEVEDTGVGMDEHTISRAFDPFFTSKAPNKGTGLGLSTCYGIVKRHRGEIWITSEPGHGTCCSVSLPLVDTDEASTAAAASLPSPRGSETILVIEDQPAVLASLQRTLRHAGYQTLSASDTEQATALAQANQQSIRLVLADVMMPGLSGPELVERLRPSLPQARVLYISGHTDELPEDELLLRKPFKPSELVRRIRQLLDGPAAP